MPIQNHKDYNKEANHLERTINYVKTVIDAVENNRNKFNENIKDAYINLDYLDSSLSYSAIMLNTALLEALENNYDQLIHARKKPYFAKMKVQLANRNQPEEFYIGKVSLYDEKMETPLAIDWRSPLASIYYDGRLGKASYLVENVTHNVELYLKRQYVIKEGCLADFVDVDISVSDTFLQASLEANAGDKLKDIVSTIQAEQNAIIRADIHKPLIVQGVAGSGKTTIALHRIAYLIYTYSETFKPEHFMIIAPNNLFLDYISQVLPELGAHRVRQTTYIKLMLEVLGKNYKIVESNNKLIELIENNAQDKSSDNKLSQNELLVRVSKLKSSMHMKNILDKYIEDVKTNIIPEKDFYIGDEMIFRRADILKLFLEDFSYLPLHKRVSKIKSHVTKKTKFESIRLLDEISDHYNKKLKRMFCEEETEDRRLKIVSMINQRDSKIEFIKKSAKIAASTYMNLFQKVELLEYYRRIITNPEAMAEYSKDVESKEVYRGLCNSAAQLFKEKKLEIEDLAPLAYLKKKLYGLEPQDIKHVVIDEAQDFSEFQIYVLKDVLETERFTILGDLSQGIHMHRGIENWDSIRNQIFEKDVNYLELEQSYRTTVEIMNLANKILKNCTLEGIVLAKPVVRHGKMPNVKSYCSKKELIQSLEEKVTEFKAEGYTSIAIIGKTQEECAQIKKNLMKNGEISPVLLDEKVVEFNHELVIIPSYLAKGLEFDAVIIVTLDASYLQNDLDIKLLYVSMTRAMHRLDIFCCNNTIPMLVNNLTESDLQ